MNFIDQITNYIIRPTRQRYHINRLGPRQTFIPSHCSHPHNSFQRQNFISVFRDDYEIRNRNNLNICYSFYTNHMTPYPDLCIVYLHANNGSRVQGLHYLNPIFSNKLNVCLLDFSGSGCSQGEYITLGPNECQDLDCVYQHMRKTKGIKNMVLWGRSMGACTALMYCSKYKQKQNVISLILDSPFEDLRTLVKQVAADKTSFPSIFFEPILSFVDSRLEQKIGHRFKEYQMMQYIRNQDESVQKVIVEKSRSPIPVLFLASVEDKLVRVHHVQNLYKRYPGKQKVEKFIQYTKNEHHQDRDMKIIGECLKFLDSITKNYCSPYKYPQSPSRKKQQEQINSQDNNSKFSFKTQQIVKSSSRNKLQKAVRQPQFCVYTNRSNFTCLNNSMERYKNEKGIQISQSNYNELISNNIHKNKNSPNHQNFNISNPSDIHQFPPKDKQKKPTNEQEYNEEKRRLKKQKINLSKNTNINSFKLNLNDLHSFSFHSGQSNNNRQNTSIPKTTNRNTVHNLNTSMPLSIQKDIKESNMFLGTGSFSHRPSGNNNFNNFSSKNINSNSHIPYTQNSYFRNLQPKSLQHDTSIHNLHLNETSIVNMNGHLNMQPQVSDFSPKNNNSNHKVYLQVNKTINSQMPQVLSSPIQNIGRVQFKQQRSNLSENDHSKLLSMQRNLANNRKLEEISQGISTNQHAQPNQKSFVNIYNGYQNIQTANSKNQQRKNYDPNRDFENTNTTGPFSNRMTKFLDNNNAILQRNNMAQVQPSKNFNNKSDINIYTQKPERERKIDIQKQSYSNFRPSFSNIQQNNNINSGRAINIYTNNIKDHQFYGYQRGQVINEFQRRSRQTQITKNGSQNKISLNFNNKISLSKNNRPLATIK